jgi:hypothetical protein
VANWNNFYQYQAMLQHCGLIPGQTDQSSPELGPVFGLLDLVLNQSCPQQG